MMAPGLTEERSALNSGLFLILSGWVMGNPNSRARALTGDGESSRPRPRGLSGCVTTNETENRAASNFSSAGKAKRGVPQKTRLRDGLNLYTYHSPALISLRILRFIKSRFSALMWLI